MHFKKASLHFAFLYSRVSMLGAMDLLTYDNKKSSFLDTKCYILNQYYVNAITFSKFSALYKIICNDYSFS